MEVLLLTICLAHIILKINNHHYTNKNMNHFSFPDSYIHFKLQGLNKMSIDLECININQCE